MSLSGSPESRAGARSPGAADGAGWLFRMELTDRAVFDALMDAAAYSSFVETL